MEHQQLSLANYAIYRKLVPCLTLEEVGILRKQIKEVVEQIGQYSSKAISPQKLQHLISVKQSEIRGLALFLLDFQGFHDEIFENIQNSIKSFTHFILIFDIPFYDVEYRLIEISKDPKLAVYRPERPNIAAYILRNLNAYSREDLQEVYKKLKRTPLIKINADPTVILLYNVCRKQMPFWKR